MGEMNQSRSRTEDGSSWLRRGWMKAALSAGAIASWSSSVRARDEEEAGASKLIVRNRRPLDAETPVEAFKQWRTPNDQFFVRSHFGPPATGIHPWRLNVAGLVERPQDLGLDDLRRLEQVTLPAVLQCSGNGRAFFTPIVPGAAWERGAVGNAEWTGVRLRDVLDRAGLKAGAAHLHMIGTDGPPNPKTPAFLRSLPIEKALDPHTLIALTMNGEPLPVLHGGPARLVVPGWTGNHWLKWLRLLTVSETEAPGEFMQSAYRLPRASLPEGVTPKPEDMVPLTAMNVKSLIVGPSPSARLKPGRTEVHGVAWTGEGRITRVDVQIDGQPWTRATLEGPDHRFAWRSWRLPWTAEPGRHVVRSRATDSNGQTQAETTPWNKSGYLWNTIDQVECEVI